MCDLRVIRVLHASQLMSEDMPDEMVEAAGGAVLLLPQGDDCKEHVAAEFCIGQLCNASR